MNELFAIKLDKQKVLHEQVRDQIRNLILSGKLAPGDKLPSTVHIAALLSTHVPTVHIALTNLAKEGLLVRYNGKGTFVRKREEKLTCVAVFDGVAVNTSLYLQALHKALKEELRQADIEMDVWLDPRPEEQFAEPWLPFVKAATHREFQAIIATGTSWSHIQWQSKLSVPTAFQTSANFPNAVDSNVAQFAELSVRALAQQGCRSVGVIAALPTWFTNPDGSRHVYTGFYERLMDLIGDLGLTVKNEWMRVPTAQTTVDGQTQEQFGYEEFLRLWSQPEKPAGLIVYPDTAVRGVILGLREKQVRVPEDLKLVFHKNESIDLLCPMPATFVVSSERALARALIEQVQRQFRGEKCEPIHVGFRLSSTENAGKMESIQPTTTERSS